MKIEPEQIEHNVRSCDTLLDILEAMSNSGANERNTLIKIGEIENEVKKLQQLYKQIIP